MKLSALVGRQKPIVDANIQMEHTVAASSGLAPADIARILASSRNVQRARQIFRYADPPAPMTIPVPSYGESGETTAQVDYVEHVLEQLVEPTTSAEEQVSRILKIADVLGENFANWRAEVFQWYEFLATFFALNQKYSASAILFDHLHQGYQHDYSTLGDYQKNLCLRFLGTTIPYRLGTVLFKVFVDLSESFRDITVPSRDDKRGAITIAGEEVTPMVLVIDLESIHSPIDAILHAERGTQSGLLESLFTKTEKDFNEEQRQALAALQPELAANPMVLSLYYRLASTIIRYHARLYTAQTTWQDYVTTTSKLIEAIVARCRSLPVELSSFPDFKGMYNEVVKAKQVRQQGVGMKSGGILDRLQGRSGDLQERYERRMAKLVTDLTISDEDETVGLQRLEQLFSELDLHQELSAAARAELISNWNATARENNLNLIAARACHLHGAVVAMTLPTDEIGSRFDQLEDKLVTIAGSYFEAIHGYERYLARDPDKAVQELLVSALDELAGHLVARHEACANIASSGKELSLRRGRVQDLTNPISLYMKELALVDEIDDDRQRCEALDVRITKAQQVLGLATAEKSGPIVHWSGRIDQLLSRVRHTNDTEWDCLDGLVDLFVELEMAQDIEDEAKLTVVDRWTEAAIKANCYTLAGRNEHLRVRLLMATLPMSDEATQALNQQLLVVFSTLTDACALMMRSTSAATPEALHERLYEAFMDVGDMLCAFKENYEVIAEHPNEYEVSRQQLSDLRDPLAFFIQARNHLSSLTSHTERLEELDWKIADLKRQI